MSNGITGRDGYIICKALAYAIETIERLPQRWQELGDLEDMKLILDEHDEHLAQLCRQSALSHLDGAAGDSPNPYPYAGPPAVEI
jgi:hypothetical protein